MAKCTYKLDKNKEIILLETKITDTVNAFSAYTHEVEKSLLTIKPEDFIKEALWRRITALYSCQKNFS